MRVLLPVFFAVALCSCADEPKHIPDIRGHNVGYVRATDWNDRSFILEEEGTRITFQLKSCAGSMPIWPGEKIEIWYRRTEWYAGAYKDWCQEFDRVVRIQ